MSDWNAYIQRIEDCSSSKELEEIDLELFSRKHGKITEAMKGLRELSEEEKKSQAVELNRAKTLLTDALEAKKKSLSGSAGDDLDISLNLPRPHRGHLHLVPEFMEQLEEVFGRMGFDVAFGPEIESEENNFDKLNIPPDHPARDSQDTFWIKGVKNTVLRTHTSPVQIRYMMDREPPFRMLCPGRTYRKDEDATHSPMFHQFEGLMIDKDISVANMMGTLIHAMQELVSKDAEFRFRTAYFPFVEPGLEMDMMWQGDVSDSREGKWLEMGGCGMVHPNVLKNVGIDPDKWQGFAFGFGVERPIMIKHQIPDLRAFYDGNLQFLEQF